MHTKMSPTFSPAMAASNCMSQFRPTSSPIHSRPPPAAARAIPEAAIDISAATGSPSRCESAATNLRWNRPCGVKNSEQTGGTSRCESGTTSLRWNRPCGMRNSHQTGGASSFCLSASSIVGQQGDASASSRDDSSPAFGATLGLVQAPRTAANVVQEFYDRINCRDYVGVANLFAEDCVYEDFNYSNTTQGREEVLKFFEKVMSSFGTELKFVIDDMTRDDPNAVGVIWHLDWRGKAFPFSRGCSFYRCVVNSVGDRQIRFARDIVEPATKPGDVAMVALRLVTSLFERFPQIADRL